jgi:hypothetical protein
MVSIEKEVNNKILGGVLFAIGFAGFTGYFAGSLTYSSFNPFEWKKESEYRINIQKNYEKQFEGATNYYDSLEVYHNLGIKPKLEDATFEEKERIFMEAKK